MEALEPLYPIMELQKPEMTLYPAKPKCQAGSHVLTEKYHNPNLATCDPRSGTIVAKLPIADSPPNVV